jgi:hypothetical protein
MKKTTKPSKKPTMAKQAPAKSNPKPAKSGRLAKAPTAKSPLQASARRAKASRGKPAPQPAKKRAKTAEPKQVASPAPPPQEPPSSPEPIYEYSGARKTTVSFYAAEHDQVDRILDLLIKARRHRGGFSDAIKVALRLCPLDVNLIGEAWDEARATDKRTSRGRAQKA